MEMNIAAFCVSFLICCLDRINLFNVVMFAFWEDCMDFETGELIPGLHGGSSD